MANILHAVMNSRISSLLATLILAGLMHAITAEISIVGTDLRFPSLPSEFGPRLGLAGEMHADVHAERRYLHSRWRLVPQLEILLVEARPLVPDIPPRSTCLNNSCAFSLQPSRPISSSPRPSTLVRRSTPHPCTSLRTAHGLPSSSVRLPAAATRRAHFKPRFSRPRTGERRRRCCMTRTCQGSLVRIRCVNARC